MNVSPVKILLLSFYELGRQPFGIASPAAWLRADGHLVTVTDCSIESLPLQAAREADLIAYYVPMHTATRLAIESLQEIKTVNPDAHLCFYGLYAPVNEEYLRANGVHTILGGEFETGLVQLTKRLGHQSPTLPQQEAVISLERQQFVMPDRADMPGLDNYARLCTGNGQEKITGYVETTRGCKHLCRHCPIVPVYNGRFRIVQQSVVLADIRQQIANGATHITFGDPDFLNGPGHVLPIVEKFHQEFPEITYDVTIKVEHLLKYRRHLPTLRDTGCLFITSAVESVDDQVLEILDKGHTRVDFIEAVRIVREIGIHLNPTLVAFTPWLSLEGYFTTLQLMAELDLVDSISPVQWAIRLLIPNGSRLLSLPETQKFLGKFDAHALGYQWTHPDPRMDLLYEEIRKVAAGKASRQAIFKKIWEQTAKLLGSCAEIPVNSYDHKRTAVPYLNEPWYC